MPLMWLGALGARAEEEALALALALELCWLM